MSNIPNTVYGLQLINIKLSIQPIWELFYNTSVVLFHENGLNVISQLTFSFLIMDS